MLLNCSSRVLWSNFATTNANLLWNLPVMSFACNYCTAKCTCDFFYLSGCKVQEMNFACEIPSIFQSIKFSFKFMCFSRESLCPGFHNSVHFGGNFDICHERKNTVICPYLWGWPLCLQAWYWGSRSSACIFLVLTDSPSHQSWAEQPWSPLLWQAALSLGTEDKTIFVYFYTANEASRVKTYLYCLNNF